MSDREQISKMESIRNDIAKSGMDESNELYLYRWMIEQNFTVQRYSNYPGPKQWLVLDFDSNEIGRGENAIAALQNAHEFIDNPRDAEWKCRDERRITERDIDRADHLRDVAKDNS